ncbi:palindromic element RPE4 domain-containing protein [Rickettsia endosymbiont of Ixodes pacificus]|uniref:palindromic element RPE4 domain-containing protein n=1 Tax=Rickettsia endosymbiont of Ixodes pacificus TaxID=1133329 RepID=UPI001E4682F0|nr:palindromic element RPE4 domain-containing protein [Rickettsia endosymbiont of Ixodes pacificus]
MLGSDSSVSPRGLTTGSIKKLKRLDPVVKPQDDSQEKITLLHSFLKIYYYNG